MGGRRRNNKPTRVSRKQEGDDWSFQSLGGKPPSGTQGRKEGEPVIYSPEQTERYQSQWIRYQKALVIAARGPDAIKNGEYYYRAANRPYPDTRKLKGKDDWWPERPPLVNQPLPWEGDRQYRKDDSNSGFDSPTKPSSPYENYNNENYKNKNPSDPNDSLKDQNESPFPPESPNYGGMPGFSNDFDMDNFESEGLNSPPGGGAYSRSPEEFWRVTPGGAPWVLNDGGGEGDWVDLGNDNLTNSGGGDGSFTIEGENAPAPPFTGGQCCAKSYTVTATLVYTGRDAFGNCRTEQASFTGSATRAGRIVNIRGGESSTFKSTFVEVTSQDCNGVYTVGNVLGISDTCYVSHTATVTTADGSPDNCGDPPLLFERA